MNKRENSYYIGRERHYNREQNQAELLRLREQAEEMRSELKEGTLSDAAKLDLQEQLGHTLQVIQILRESIIALSTENVLLVDDISDSSDAAISVEITDPSAYWLHENQTKVAEIRELYEEYAQYQDLELTGDAAVRAAKLRADIETLQREAEYTMGKYFESA